MQPIDPSATDLGPYTQTPACLANKLASRGHSIDTTRMEKRAASHPEHLIQAWFGILWSSCKHCALQRLSSCCQLRSCQLLQSRRCEAWLGLVTAAGRARAARGRRCGRRVTYGGNSAMLSGMLQRTIAALPETGSSSQEQVVGNPAAMLV